MTLRNGTLFATRYRIKETPIQPGSTGHVYRAHDERLDRIVALKVIRVELAQQETVRQQFLAEARMLAKLQHPNIVTIFDASLEPQPYLVMAYVGSHNLRREMIDGWQRRRINWQHVLGVAIEVCEALAYVHQEAGVIHGDLKPENVLVRRVGTPQQEVILTDFGLARLMAAPNEEVAGTPAYLSPEQVMGEAVDGRSDLYALGVIMYEWLANGRLPIPVHTLQEARRLHPHHLPTELDGSVPNGLKQIITKLLQKEPGNRFGDAQLLKAELQKLYVPTIRPFTILQTSPSSEIRLPAQTPPGNYLAVSEHLPLYKELAPKQSLFIIGSDPVACDLTLAGDDIAAKHARLRKEGTLWYIEPMGNQIIYVDEQRIHKNAAVLTPDKKVRIGSHFLQLRLTDDEVTGISDPFRLEPHRLEVEPTETADFKVVIRNGTKSRGYYHIALDGLPETAVSWFNIPDDGIPLDPTESGTLSIHAQIPPEASPGSYSFKVQLKSLATSEGQRETEGELFVRQSGTFSINITPTVLARQEISWVTITNDSNQKRPFLLSLSDKEEKVLFAIVSEEAQTPAAPRQQTAVSQPTPSSPQLPDAPTIPPILRRLPYIGSLVRGLTNNPLSRWLRQLRQRTRQVQGIANQLPQSQQVTAAETPPPSPLLNGRWHRAVQHRVAELPPKGTAKVGFRVEARSQPFISRRSQEHVFTVGVSNANDAPQLASATLVVPPQISSRSAIFLTLFILLLALILLGSRGIADQNKVAPTRQAAAAWATQDIDEDLTPNGAEIVARTDPRVALTATPLATSTTPTPTPTAQITATPEGTAVPTTPILQLFSQPADDGYLVYYPEDLITTFSDGDTLIVGDDATNGIIRTIISFDTSAVSPDANIKEVALFLWLTPVEETEDSPVTDPGMVIPRLGHYLNADMAVTGFGSGPYLEAADFSAPVMSTGLGVVHQARTIPNKSGQIRLDFSTDEQTVIQAIQDYDVVEFRLYLELPSNENEQAEQLHFFSGDSEDEAKRPFLQLTYGINP